MGFPSATVCAFGAANAHGYTDADETGGTQANDTGRHRDDWPRQGGSPAGRRRTGTGPTAPALVLRRLAKAYGDVLALDGVDLEVEAGEVLALVGPNGAGKTTLLSSVAGLVQPDDGDISVLGVDARARPSAARRLLGLAPQRLGLAPTLTVEENLVFSARLAGMTAAAARSSARDAADDLGVAPLLRRPAGRLSGGEQRRVHVACSVVHRPPVLLLDESTSGIDPSARGAVLDLVRRLSAEGTAVCFSTHQLDEVEELGASVAILHHGHLVARDKVPALVARHGSAVVDLRFDGEMSSQPALDGVEVDGGRVRITDDDPGRALARVLPALGDRLPRLRSVDVVRAGLGTVFLALTGERYPGVSERGAADADAAPEQR
ncbi:MAG TPA: ABC transporter ATP-binding protein [Acidimicrobiales bacterium]|nr:ABC transporter ATP-binding protein [Acidimicrobiales bacterium]